MVLKTDHRQTDRQNLASPSERLFPFTIERNLLDGKILVIDGYGYIGPQTSTDLYNPLARTWILTGNMNVARVFHTASMLSNRKVIVNGGSDNASTELYDPLTGAWSTIGSTNVLRTNHAATLFSDRKVFITGGYNGFDSSDSTEWYDPLTDNCTLAAQMNTARREHTVSTLSNGILLVSSGYSGTRVGIIRSVELYRLV